MFVHNDDLLPCTQASSLEEMRRLLDALEAELRAADEEAAAAGTGPETPVPLSQLPEALTRAQVQCPTFLHPDGMQQPAQPCRSAHHCRCAGH